MKEKEESTLTGQASRLYKLELEVKKQRNILNRLMEKGTPCNSPKMIEAMAEFQAANEERRRLEQEHQEYKAKSGAEKGAGSMG